MAKEIMLNLCLSNAKYLQLFLICRPVVLVNTVVHVIYLMDALKELCIPSGFFKTTALLVQKVKVLDKRLNIDCTKYTGMCHPNSVFKCCSIIE